MSSAFWLMCNDPKQKPSSKVYSEARQAAAKRSSELNSGRGNPMFGVSLPSRNKGLSGRKHTEETKEKIRRSSIGRKYGEEHKRNISLRMTVNNPFKGKNHSEEVRRHLSESLSGDSNPMYGRTWVMSEEEKQKRRLSADPSPKPKVICEHCGKVGGKPVMARYHGDNCKQKK